MTHMYDTWITLAHQPDAVYRDRLSLLPGSNDFDLADAACSRLSNVYGVRAIKNVIPAWESGCGQTRLVCEVYTDAGRQKAYIDYQFASPFESFGFVAV